MARTPAASVMSDDQDGPYRARDSKINSLAPGKFEWKFGYLIFHIISVTDIWGISCEFAFRWMSLDLTDDKSTLVQVMAWCHQATSHYLSQCWPRSLPPHGVTRSQWVNVLAAVKWGCYLKFVVFYPISRIDILSISCETSLCWMQQDLTADKSTLIPVMAWCLQVESQYLNQCWTRSMPPYAVTRPQGVNCQTYQVLIKLADIFTWIWVLL